jgi:hypothetical protein
MTSTLCSGGARTRRGLLQPNTVTVVSSTAPLSTCRRSGAMVVLGMSRGHINVAAALGSAAWCSTGGHVTPPADIDRTAKAT